MNYFIHFTFFVLAFYTNTFAQSKEKNIGLYILPNQVFQYEDGKRTFNDELSILSKKRLDSLLDNLFLTKYKIKKYTNEFAQQSISNDIRKIVIDRKERYLLKKKISDSLIHLVDNIAEEKAMFFLVTGREKEIFTSKSIKEQKTERIVSTVVGTIAGSLISGGLSYYRPGSSQLKRLDLLISLFCIVINKKNKKIEYSNVFSIENTPLNVDVTTDLINMHFKDYFKKP